MIKYIIALMYAQPYIKKEIKNYIGNNGNPCKHENVTLKEVIKFDSNQEATDFLIEKKILGGVVVPMFFTEDFL